jgi:peptidoglycan/LPS O-acetylase OafA/YrhL
MAAWTPDLREIFTLSMFVLIPAGLMLLVRPVARWVFLLLGVVSLVAMELFAELGGPDSPALILPMIAIGVAAGALLVEAFAFPIRLIRRRRANQPVDSA